jgi:sulfate permease, SulP family
MAKSDIESVAHRLVPILDWIPGYRREWLLPDVFAGVALWAVMVPEGMAYAGIVGVPPIMGLYTIVPALLGYALLGHVAAARRRTRHRYWSDLRAECRCRCNPGNCGL